MKNYVLIVFLFFASLCQAQEQIEDTDVSQNFSGVQFSAIVNFSQFDFGGLNNYLGANNLPQVKDNFQFIPSFSVSTSLSDKDFIDVTAGRSAINKERNGHHLEQQVIFSEISFGRYIFQQNRKSLFLAVAYGNVWYNVDIHDNANSGSFTGALTEYSGSLKLSSKNNQYIAIKSGFDWAVGSQEDILVGVRIGYRIGVGKNQWEIKDQAYNDSPESSGKGFFVGLTASLR